MKLTIDGERMTTYALIGIVAIAKAFVLLIASPLWVPCALMGWLIVRTVGEERAEELLR